ncbi:MAG: isoprenylcysteine carboxylmethyltransferase family protein [Alphaproteobacteria bacterium]|nr:isoprenylcysteine carboxylmethyltransferase family protein [Alphaproteobacteria bacterium]TAD91219.1 MAG: isoprenylcysteine carboxylmethyltransferase family protein [Alphaproteobacteria bacterium]
MSTLNTRVPPPVIVVLVGLIMVGLTEVGPDLQLDRTLRWLLATVIAALGLAVMLVAAWSFRQAGTTLNPRAVERTSALVTTGAFTISRNPMYLGMLALTVALALVLGGIAAFLGPVLFWAYITRFQILPEELVLARRFGAEFDAYRERVRRWL